ncbi:MAG: DUF4956 domain-containing protein [Actinomycetales bacterium]|nr:DUF4956 domain-containing protein [Actinomycetales bacterium]
MDLTLLLADLVAITILTFGLYLPRHHRRDLAVAYVGVNVGVLAVSAALGTGTVGAGLGLGLFGVLSIIRLRSTELEHQEVAYYFAALALGLIAGLGAHSLGLTAAIMALVLGAIAVADSRWVLARHRRQDMVLDRAFTDEAALIAHVQTALGAKVHAVTVKRVDLVNDTTTVEVRYELPRGAAARADGLAVSRTADAVAAEWERR